jgi:hypothetical protein
VLSSLRWSLALAVALVGALLAPSAEPADKKAPNKPLDALKLPADAIIVIINNLDDLTAMFPRNVRVPLEQLQALEAEVSRLKAALEAQKLAPTAPGKLHLEGRVEGNRAFLKATFEFATDKPKTFVTLGCKPALASNPMLTSLGEGKGNLYCDLRSDAENLLVYLDEAQPKGCQLTLDLALGLPPAQGNARSLELKLPGAVATSIELTLPTGARDVRLGDRPLAETAGLRLKDQRVVSGTLGAADKLSLSWKQGKTAGTGPKLLEAEGSIHVSVDGRAVNTVAKLTLKVLGGSTDRWEVLVPPGADLKVSAADEARLAGKIEAIEQAFASLRIIRLKEASAETLTVTVRLSTSPDTKNQGQVPVGPFIVRGAVRQPGSIFVTSAGVEPRLHPHGDATRRDPTGDEKTMYPAPWLRVYGYDVPPQPVKPTMAYGPTGSYSLLDIEAEAVLGQVRTQTTNTLELRGDSGRRQWSVFTRIHADLINQGTVERIEIQVPKECVLVPSANNPPAPVKKVKAEEGKVTLELSTGETWSEFTTMLEFHYPVVVLERGEELFELPRVLDAAAGSRTEVKVKAPKDVELTTPGRPGVTALVVTSSHELEWKPEAGSPDAERPPAAIAVAWRPYQPEVHALADVTLTAPDRQAQVHHELRYRFPPSPRGSGEATLAVTLRLPAGVQLETFKVSGGRLLAAEDKQVRRIQLDAPAGQEAVLRLDYAFLLPTENAEGDTTFAVPLVVPEQVTHGETRVRVWSEPGTLPELARPDSGWALLNIEKVRGKGKPVPLPVLVLETQRVDLPLTLRLAEVVGERVTVLADRALIRVEVTEGQGYRYRASFHLTQLLTKNLDIEVPAPVPRLGLAVKLDGAPVRWSVVDENGQRSDSGRVARLELDPELVQRSVLEVSYQILPGHVSGGTFQTVLQPPVLRGEPGRVLTRWQVTLPAGWVALGPEGGAGMPRVWRPSGWLLVPRLAASAGEMEQWFKGNENLPISAEFASAPNPDLICLRSGLEPLTITHAPFKPWLWCCSLAVLLSGLAMYFLARRASRGSPTWFWVCLTLLTFGIGALWLFRPTALAALAYGSELGAVVLVVFAAGLWLMHERQRRQIVFLPSFRRGRGASSIVRTAPATASGGSGPKPPPGEPSTVDVPQKAASSH